MNMLAVVGFLILLSIVWLSFETSLPKRYRSRNCEGAQWRRAFPQATKNDIREFLLLFTSAFAFPDSGKLKFSPNDRVWEIYRDLYPNRWIADAMELETFTDDLNTKHGIALGEIWSEKLTLGEVFAYVQRSSFEYQCMFRSSALGRFRLAVTVCEFFSLARCHDEANGWVRPKADVCLLVIRPFCESTTTC
jgi:propanediol dehydratase small subunit